MQHEHHHSHVPQPPPGILSALNTPQNTPRGTGCFLQHTKGGGAGSALPVHVVPWIRQRRCDGTHSSPPHMLPLFLPSHWCCSSRFFQIISFLAPLFTNQDSAFPTQPFHLESSAVGTFPLKIITRTKKKTGRNLARMCQLVLEETFPYSFNLFVQWKSWKQ